MSLLMKHAVPWCANDEALPPELQLCAIPPVHDVPVHSLSFLYKGNQSALEFDKIARWVVSMLLWRRRRCESKNVDE